jgi:hypothetical protein
MLEPFRAAMLVAATITMGLMAGVFGLYAHTVMPGLGRTDNRTFVGAFQSIDGALINSWFLASFLGTLVFTALAAVLHGREDGRPVLPWIVASGRRQALAGRQPAVSIAARSSPRAARAAAGRCLAGRRRAVPVRPARSAEWSTDAASRWTLAADQFGARVEAWHRAR